MNITWIGEFTSQGAYPLINRKLTEQFEKMGYTILRNFHTRQSTGEPSPVSITCVYPPYAFPRSLHKLNIIISLWEFSGEYGLPNSFIGEFNKADLVVTCSKWNELSFGFRTDTPVKHIQLGFDPVEFPEQIEPLDINQLTGKDLSNKIKLLYVGGTDKRHGIDVLLKTLDLLPDEFHLIMKLPLDYPGIKTDNPKATVIRDFIPLLASLYAACDVFVQPARGVGFSLPTLEAIAAGLPVIASNLPPIQEFAIHTEFVNGQWEAMPELHHIHKDCYPVWFEPDVQEFAARLMQFSAEPRVNLKTDEWRKWRDAHTWEQSAKQLMDIIEEGLK